MGAVLYWIIPFKAILGGGRFTRYVGTDTASCGWGGNFRQEGRLADGACAQDSGGRYVGGSAAMAIYTRVCDLGADAFVYAGCTCLLDR